jgi:dTDP-4-amino-4,6-dideoxygalactose transaminase
MQFRDLGAQYRALKTEIDAGIASVLEGHDFILGKSVTILEKELAEFVGVSHCVSCANGTDALTLSLMAWDIGPGDAVFAPDFTYFATVNCAMLCGATPVLVDIDEATFNMSPAALEQAVLETLREGKLRPRVVIPVDLFGQPADYEAIRAIAEKYGMRILEDGAQGFGGEINGQKACSFGDIGTTSFFPAKPLGCYGDGGAIFTNNAEWAEKLRSLRAQGRSPEDKYDNRERGLNSRLDTMQAAILLPKLHALKAFELEAINRVAQWYTECLNGLVVTPTVLDGYYSSWAQYTILLQDTAQRRGLQAFLKERGIPSMVYYPRGMHQQTAVRSMGLSRGNFPVTERVTQVCLSLPLYPYMTEADVDMVAGAIKEYLR